MFNITNAISFIFFKTLNPMGLLALLDNYFLKLSLYCENIFLKNDCLK